MRPLAGAGTVRRKTITAARKATTEGGKAKTASVMRVASAVQMAYELRLS